ncbi:hypothetical protein MHYP_G00160430 [Metynnis hypsauchen]
MSKDYPCEVSEMETPNRTVHHDVRSAGLNDSLQLHHLQLLFDTFSQQLSITGHSQRRVRARNTGHPADTLSLEQFRSALTTAMGEESWSDKMEELFRELELSCDGHVGRETLCDCVLQQLKQSEDTSEAELSDISSEPVIRRCLRYKQYPVIRIVEVSQPPPLRYITISKRGTLTIWNSQLHVIESLELCENAGEKGGSSRQLRTWMTDAVYMPNVHKIAVASMSRNIHLVDVSTSTCFETFHLSGLRHVATALCYWYNIEAPGERCALMWGDEKGAVNLLWFLQPHKGLFETPFSKQSGPQQVFLSDICGQTSLISYQQSPKIHSEPINRIRYNPRTDLIATSSESSTSSVVIMDVDQRSDSYIWKIEKGVRCFDISWSLSLLVTAGLDPDLRIWDRYVTSRPVAVLRGHRTTVVDVAIHQDLGKIFSYSKDAVLKIWDISSERCVKTIPLRFPNIQTGHILGQGNFSLLLNLSRAPALLLSCREYLALLQLQNAASNSESAAFSCTLYRRHLRQILSHNEISAPEGKH